MGRWLDLVPRSIAARLYFVAALGALAVVFLAALALHFAGQARNATLSFQQSAMAAIIADSEIEMMLERSRRIHDTARRIKDRAWIEREGHTADVIVQALRGRYLSTVKLAASDAEEKLSDIEQYGKQVLSLALAGGHESALAVAFRQFDKAANQLQTKVKRLRAQRIGRASRGAGGLYASSQSVVLWVGSSLAILALLGLSSLLIVHSIVVKLRQLSRAVLKLAKGDLTADVSLNRSTTEIGDIARAFEVFKDNAVALATQSDRLEQLNDWFEVALDNMSRGLSMFDAGRRLLVCNRQYREMYALDEAHSRPGALFEDILRYRMEKGTCLKGDTAETMFDAWPIGVIRPAESHLVHELADGRAIAVSLQSLKNGGWVAVHEDITEKRKSERRVAKLAREDTLTGLANRHHFMETIQEALVNKRDGGFAILWIDLDGFKAVNDTLGHPAGDALLQAVGRRMQTIVRRDDFTARLGGDEFAIVQCGSPTPDQTEAMAARLLKKLAEPVVFAGQSITIGASIGSVTAPRDGGTAEELIRRADIALYRAKSQGKRCYVAYETHLENELLIRRGVEADLREALAKGELSLHYQPILDLETGTVTSCEALMRWCHAERGFVPPDVFIPIAEDIGLIGELGAWALKTACEAACSWPAHVRVAVNLSADQVRDGGILDAAKAALAGSGLDPKRLELEVTETLLLRDDTRTLCMLHELRDLGITFSLDDFGTGYASLSYLRNFPFDSVKVDRSFVRDMGERHHSRAIVHAVVNLARMLGMKTVAEGVETEAQYRLVAEAGCSAVQGYLIGRPVVQAQVQRVIEQAEARQEPQVTRFYPAGRKS